MNTTTSPQSKAIQINRPDGRSGGGELRPLSCEVSCLSQPDASAKFSCGNTQILSAVYGPASPKNPSKEHPYRGTLSIVYKNPSRGYGVNSSSGTTNAGDTSSTSTSLLCSDREVENIIGESLGACIDLDAYPRSIIEIVVHVIKADGGVVATAINTAVVAVLDAGIKMKSVPIATTCLLAWSQSSSNHFELKLDPTSGEELDENSSVVVLVTDSVIQEEGVISSLTFGQMTAESYLSCIGAAAKASKAVLAFIRLAIEQKCNREAQTLWDN